jgi:choline dehydrogenase-like flavoprotein
MANLNIDSVKERTFDAIVIGSGISGGWAAKELTERGLKTLVLERGRDVKHNIDYPTTNMMPWEFKHRGQIPQDIQEANPVVSRCYAFKEDAMHFFVKDNDHPYVQEKPSTGYAATRWAANRCSGPGRPSAGATSTLPAPPATALP